MSYETIIVDKHDDIIGYKQSGTIGRTDIYRVSTLLIKNSCGKYLLAQRSLSKKNNPWEWSFSVAGTIEKWETYDTNIQKEIEEEIGIVKTNYTKLYKARIQGKHNFFCQFYMANMDVPLSYFTIEKEEVAQIRWFTKEEILKWNYAWYHISKTLIQELDRLEKIFISYSHEKTLAQ